MVLKFELILQSSVRVLCLLHMMLIANIELKFQPLGLKSARGIICYVGYHDHDVKSFSSCLWR